MSEKSRDFRGTMFANTRLATMMSSVAFAALCAPSAWAQETPAPAEEDEARTLQAVVVTARRDTENLQVVPVSAQVVSGEDLSKLAITGVEEISKLAPGLSLVNAGSNTSVTLRGVTWQPGSGTPATPLYFNEAPFDPGNTIVSMFDIGQVEVLRGPQGTSRGAPSISGAITITTAKPNLSEIGGFVQGLYGSDDHTNVQAAINFPIIKDMLAVRLAANVEDSEGRGIHSVNSAIEPMSEDRSYRATVLFEPTDNLSLQAMYQQRKTENANFTQVEGTGNAAFPGVPGLYPAVRAGYNGPALSLGDRASVQDRPSLEHQHIDLLTVNAGWEVLGHNLTYNFGRQYNRGDLIAENATDPLNILPGFETFATVSNVGLPDWASHEIRLSSTPSADRPFDYDIGWFSKESDGTINFDAPTYLTGAFGHPLTALPGAVTTPNSRYVLGSSTNIGIGQVFSSFYGNARFRLGENTELSGGVALVKDKVPVSLRIQTFAGVQAIVNPQLPLRAFCPAVAPPGLTAVASPVYTTGVVCDLLLPAGLRNSSQSNSDKYDDTLYNLSLSHRLSDDVLVYATTGTSFRSGLPAINNPGLPANLVTPEPEEAVSYELGVKSEVGGVRINGSVFQLDYTNQLTSFEGVDYINAVTGRTARTSLAFYRNIDALVRGFEVELAAQPTDHLFLGANLSYSRIESEGGNVPCNDASRPLNAANPINFCPSPVGQVLNQQSPIQITVNGSYDRPVTEALDGYLRFTASHKGDNPNFGNFRNAAGGFRETDGYMIVDLFAGLTGNDGGWDLGLYAKNLFDEQAELSRLSPSTTPSLLPGVSTNPVYPQYLTLGGYDQVRSTAPQEIGIKLRYSFGAR